MKKMLLVLCLLPLLGIAQQPAPPKLLSGKDTLAASVEKGKRIISTVTVKVKLSNTFTATKNKVTFAIEKGTMSVTPSFIDDSSKEVTKYVYEIPKDVWPEDCAGKEISIPLVLSVPYISEEAKKVFKEVNFEQVGQIIMDGDLTQGHKIVIRNDVELLNTKYNPDKSFWVEVGSNFDLLDGIQANNPFFGVFFHKRDVRPLCKEKNPQINNAHKKLGFFAGVYGSKTISVNETENLFIRNYFNNNSFLPGKPDSIRIFKDAGKYAVKTSVRTTGLFASPQFRLTNGSANSDGLHIFFALWAELQWQQVTQENDFSGLVRIDSQIVAISQLVNLSKDGKPFTNNQKATSDIRTHYIGAGFPIEFREKEVHLFLNPIIGASNQPTSDFLSTRRFLFSDELTGNQGRAWNAFYTVQFRLNEEKYGFAFTGEVRGLLRRGNPPFVSLSFSKKFDLTKFLEFK